MFCLRFGKTLACAISFIIHGNPQSFTMQVQPSKIEDEKHLLILGHVRFMSGTLAATCLIQILMPYLGWLLLGIWTMFLVKITYCWDKPFYKFDIFPNENNTSIVRKKDKRSNYLQFRKRESYILYKLSFFCIIYLPSNILESCILKCHNQINKERKKVLYYIFNKIYFVHIVQIGPPRN